MSQKQPEQSEHNSISWEEAVFRYLEENPSYFKRNPEILAGLEIPHPETGEAISLIERQVQVLREKNQGLTEQLQDLVQFARDNDKVSDRLHQFGLAIVGASSIDDILDISRQLLAKEFELDSVTIKLSQGSTQADSDVQQLEKFMISTFGKNSDSLQPVCKSQPSDEELIYLFSDEAANIETCALVPLISRAQAIIGVLALGSCDPSRFEEQMGTAYLAKFGSLLSARLDSFGGLPAV